MIRANDILDEIFLHYQKEFSYNFMTYETDVEVVNNLMSKLRRDKQLSSADIEVLDETINYVLGQVEEKMFKAGFKECMRIMREMNTL